MQKKPNNFGLKYGHQNHNEKCKWINKMTRELEGFEKGLKEEMHINLLKTTPKNTKLENARPWWNAWFLVLEIHLHLLQTCTYLQKAHVHEWMNKWRAILIKRQPLQIFTDL